MQSKGPVEQEVVGTAVRGGFYRSTYVERIITQCLAMDLGLDQLRRLKNAIKRPPLMQICASAQLIRVLSPQLQSRSR